MISIPGYRDLTCIYESDSSQIFRAHREQDSLPVVLKRLREDCPSPQELIRYRREYAITRALAGHPGVIQALELREQGDSFCIVLEDFGADSLMSWLTRRAFSLGERLKLALKMATSLGEVHAARIIHKDINLWNVVYNPESDTLKLIDFGTSTQLTRESPEVQSPEVLEGTLATISPEQTGRMNRAVDYRTDFYSLGAAFYRLFTGRQPFEAEDPMELVHCHIARVPEPPHQICREVPEVLSGIVMKLLSKTPEERYQSVEGIVTDLSHCLSMLEQTGEITPFPLGQRDLSERLIVSQKLYGREQELKLLLAAFDRVSAGGKEMTLIAGYSGIGKTALVQELYRPLTERRGYFVSGKFEELKRDTPYTAIIDAFKQLVRYLLTEPEEQIQQWRTDLLAALGPNGKVIGKLIPEIEHLIGAQPEVEELRPNESQNRFNFVFQSFVQALSQPAHPLVVFIDDLQWVDASSLKLLRLILSASDVRSFHLIGAYRDNEVDETHPFMLFLHESEQAGHAVESIFLKPLPLEQTNQLIADSLQTDAEDTRPLSEAVHQKTQGNPFFVANLLHSLAEDGLLRLDRVAASWIWDLTAIRAVDITDNVALLMASRLSRLQADARDALMLSACVGNHFDLHTLSVVLEKNPAETLVALRPALIDSFLIPLGNEYQAFEHGAALRQGAGAVRFKFAHDRIQQAAYSLIPSARIAEVHFRIGMQLLQNQGDLFDIVNHLNHGASALADPVERGRIARLNLEAGKRAKTSAAYEQALWYLTTARGLIGSGGWECDYELTREILDEAAETSYLLSDYARMETLAEEVTQNARTCLEKARICKLRVVSYVAMSQQKKAVETGLAYLGSLGYRLPREPSLLQVGLALLRAKVSLTTKRISRLEELPEMCDPTAKVALELLELMQVPAYFYSQNLFVVLICKSAGVSFQYGISVDPSFASLAMIMGIAGDLKTGYELGKLARRLSEKYPTREAKCRILWCLNGNVMFIKEHLRGVKEGLRAAYHLGIETGDFEFAAFSANYCLAYSLLLGEELPALEREARGFDAVMSKLNQKLQQSFNRIFHQCILNLMGETREPHLLKGEILDEQELMASFEKGDEKAGIGVLLFMKLLLAAYFGEHVVALSVLEKLGQYAEYLRGMFLYPRYHFLVSLVLLGAVPWKPKAEKQRLLGIVSANQRKLKKWARHAPMNHLHVYYLVEAERHRILRRPEKALLCYRRAIELAHEHAWIGEEGLACELAGRFYLERDDERNGLASLRAARRCYVRWGAKGKVSQLFEEYGSLSGKGREQAELAEQTLTFSTTQGRTTTGKAIASLDLSSVVKASQSISQEVVQGQLLNRLMMISVENAGADLGCLILHHEGSLRVEAFLDINEDRETQVLTVPLDRFERVPSQIIRYVARTRESLVLGNACQQGGFTRDDHVRRMKIRSLLCIPILQNGALTGILYLENRTARNAFTPERVEVLRVLAAQSAISLDNARLYEQLRQALAQSQESARVKAEFLSRVSHELRTPLNPIINIPEGLVARLSPKLCARCLRCGAVFCYEEGDVLDERVSCPSCQAKGTCRKERPDLTDVDLEEHLHYLKIVTAAGRQLNAVVSDILDFSVLEMGKMTLCIEPIALGALVSEVLEMVESEARRRLVRLQGPRLPEGVTMSADPQRLKQILFNLLHNAIKFSKKEGGLVALRVELLADEVRFSVQDDGIGIAPSDQRLVFESFRQLEGLATRKYGGNGLGLAIAKMLAEGHGGGISVESQEGQGSTFSVRLPRAGPAMPSISG